MMNHGAPLLLNLQPAQTVQPLTLIQCRACLTPIRHRSINKVIGLLTPLIWSLIAVISCPAAPSLGQLVRPSVSVSPVLAQGQVAQTRMVSAALRGPAQPASTFTTMHLPATLTIRTSTPGPGQSHRTFISDQNGSH